MATLSPAPSTALRRERWFFFYLSLAIALTTIAGFTLFIVVGASTFASPWWVHLHGVSLMGWLALFVLQNGLVARDNTALHRRLGVFAAGYSLWVLAMGAMVLAFNTSSGRTPPFFRPEYMIALDMSTVLGFLALTWGGIVMRKQADWHKRLMLGGTIVLIGPGLGRFVPVPLIGDHISYMLFPGHLLFFAVAIAYDLRARRKMHPAYLWGLGVLVTVTLLPNLAVNTLPLTALVQALKG